MRVLVLGDTHIRPLRARRLPDAVYDELGRVDAVLHTGDVVVADVLHELEGFAPTYAVLGNNDHSLVGVLPERRVVELAGVEVGMVHDPGPRAGRAARLRRWFPAADVVVFGHTHAPADEVGVEGQRLFNPGSPTERRRQPRHSYGVLGLAGGRVVAHRIVEIDP